MALLRKLGISIAATKLALAADRATAVRLQNNGWTFATSDEIAPASAVCNWTQRQIVVRPKVASRRNARDVKYVMPHEMGHALDFEAGGRGPSGLPAVERRPSLDLASVLGLRPDAATECLGESVAWAMRGVGKSWILSSIRYHFKRFRQDYRWAHVTHPESQALATILLDPRLARVGGWFREGDRVRRG